MDTIDLKTGDAPEADPAEARRLAREAELIAEARAELDAGEYVDAAEIGAWIDGIGTSLELPMPPVRRR